MPTPVIEQMDKSRDEVNDLLRQRTIPRKISLSCLIETGMVYIWPDVKQNRILLEHIQGHALYRSFDERLRENSFMMPIEAHQLWYPWQT